MGMISVTFVVLALIIWTIFWVVWGWWWLVFVIIGVVILEMAGQYVIEWLHRGRRAE